MFFPLAVAVLIIQACAVANDSGKLDIKEFRSLLNDTPSQVILDRCKWLIKHPDKARDKSEIDWAHQQIEKAQTNVPKIRAFLKPGNSVFDYPGLISCGRITYHGATRERPDGASGSGSYSLYLGVFLGFEGIGKSDFQMNFDEKGVITGVEDVDWLL